MAVEGAQKAILAGRLGGLRRRRRSGERRTTSRRRASLSRAAAHGPRDYPMPVARTAAARRADEPRRGGAAQAREPRLRERRTPQPVVRKDAPRPADMAPPLRRPRQGVGALRARGVRPGDSPAREDPGRGSLQPRRGAAPRDRALGARARRRRRSRRSSRAEAIAPGSPDVRTYLALHYARGSEWQQAVPLLEQVVAESPDRLPALEALAVVRERQGRVDGRARAAAEDLRAADARRPPSSCSWASWP